MKPTKIYVTANQSCCGKTMMSAYLASYLQCELVSRGVEWTSKLIESYVSSAKAGWFHAELSGVPYEVVIISVMTDGFIPLPTLPIEYKTAPARLYIHIVQSDPKIAEDAKYCIARALANIGIPGLYLTHWSITDPLRNCAIEAIVYDRDTLDDAPACVGPKGNISSYIHAHFPKQEKYPICVHHPIVLSEELQMLLFGFPVSQEVKSTIGLNHTVRFINLNAPKQWMVVRLLTVDAEWGVVVFMADNQTNALAFKRELVYALLQFIDRPNNDIILLEGMVDKDDHAWQRHLFTGLVERLKESASERFIGDE